LIASHRLLITTSLGLFTVGLGFIGSIDYRPGNSLFDHLYWSLTLLIGSFETAAGNPGIPAALQVARLLGLATLASAIWTVVALAFRDSFDDWRAVHQSGHVVVWGSSETAIWIARSYGHLMPVDRRKSVSLIGDVSPDERRRLTSAGVVVAHSGRRNLAKVVANARQVIVCLDTDIETASATPRLRAELVHNPRTRAVAVFQRPELARLLQATESRPSGDGAKAGVIDYCSLPDRLAWRVLRDFPPRSGGERELPPVVIGDTVRAREIALRAVRGWRQPAEKMDLLCLAPAGSLDWRPDIGSLLPDWSAIDSPDLTWGVAGITRAVVDWWSERAGDPDRAGIRDAASTIYLALSDDELSYPTAIRLTEFFPSARIVLLPADPTQWNGVPMIHENPNLHVVGIGSGTYEVTRLLESDWSVRLADGIEMRFEKWPSETANIIQMFNNDPDMFSAPSLALATMEALDDSGVDLSGTGVPLVLDPPEIRAMSESLLSGTSVDLVDRYCVAEFCGQVPQILGSIGLGTHRRVESLLPFDDNVVEAMAVATSEVYRRNHGGSDWADLSEFAKESNRAFARDVAVKMAVLGLSLVSGEDADTGFAFQPDELVVLSRREHERWVHLHRLAGYRLGERDNLAKTHPDIRPWSDLSATEREKDAELIEAIPEVLQAAGFGLSRLQPATPTKFE